MRRQSKDAAPRGICLVGRATACRTVALAPTGRWAAPGPVRGAAPYLGTITGLVTCADVVPISAMVT
ncbi:hypothetical protein H4687_008117 [Streptomyces stelliscabiei]|uniref:Uncharacterized protein n=1 Tax=Streptomyces stelliscabiei TaxID=146820 RepID=A0A8I0TY31_9ACTN|nr:hypothetical protein [Streptomyces stelliscabiei]